MSNIEHTNEVLKMLKDWRKSNPAIWYGNETIDASINEIERLASEIASLKCEPAPVFYVVPSAFGYCPHCQSPGISRERRPFGNDRCESGHCYPSTAALQQL